MLRPSRGGLPTAGYGAGSGGAPSPYGGSPSPYGAGAQSPYGTPGSGGGAGGSSSSTGGGGYGGYGGYNQGNGSTGGGGGGGSGSGSGSAYGGYSGGNSAYGGYSPTPNNNNAREIRNKSKKRSSKSSFQESLKDPLTWSCLVSVILFMFMMRQQFHQTTFLKNAKVKSLEQVLTTLRTLSLERENTRKQLTTLQESYKKTIGTNTELEKEKKSLHTLIDTLQEEHQQRGGGSSGNDPENGLASEMARLTQREEAWQTQIKLLQQATSRESKRATIEKFGSGPYFCEFTIRFPHEPEESNIHTFVVQMAPLDAMPHAVHLFLEQVDHDLWHNGWFYINGPHVLQAGPQADEDELEQSGGQNERALALRPFRDLHLESLSFSEYSNDFPHLPWTLGFTGRPGGPDFYINKVDNTISHGPGGQNHHDLVESADACFAKVVQGFDTLTAMSNVPTIPDSKDYEFFYDEPLQIVKVVLVPNPFDNARLGDEVAADGDTHSHSTTASESEQLLESIRDLREERHSGERVHNERRERSYREPRDHNREHGSQKASANREGSESYGDSNSRRSHKVHKVHSRPEIDHMVEP